MAVLLQTPPLNVYEHMALDEMLAQAEYAGPVLRFYAWTEGPAATFGYAQFYDCVLAQTAGAGPLCRRPTGGGIVLHGEDLTFSLLFENLRSPKEIYAQLHTAIERRLTRCLETLLQRQGAVPLGRYAPQQAGQAGACFANPVQDDVLLNGQKILGGALRRFGKTVLYQGSLQCRAARINEALRAAVLEGVSDFCGENFIPQQVSALLLEQTRNLAQTQYATAAWNGKF